MRDSLVLWDIDGTLVDMDRAGEMSLLRLMRDAYQRDFGEKLPVQLAGRTDTSIMRDLLEHLKVEATPEAVLQFQKTYLEGLQHSLPLGHARIQPGVKELLDAIHAHSEIHQALLTGNLREGARLKLSHLDLWKYFEFGAYADDSSNRNELGPFALRRAKEVLGIDFPPDRVYIVGDTPHDIACGQVIDAKTIAVATGHFSVAQLQACDPTHVFSDLTDTAALLRILVG